MRQLSVCLGLTLCLFVSIAGVEARQKKGPQKEEAKPTLDADNLKPGNFHGKMVSPPGTDGVFTVDVEYQYLEPKKGTSKENKLAQALVREQQQIQKEMNQARVDLAAGRDPTGHLLRIQRLQAQMQQQVARAQAQNVDLAKNFNLKTGTQRVEFHASADVKVRMNEPAQVFTEKGDVKKFTPAELKEMKGKNPSLPGYEGNLADLKRGQSVQVFQSRPKPAAKNPDADITEEQKTYKNVVTVILVYGEDKATADTASKKSK